MSCIECYDAAMDQCHCYFWERKIAAILILSILWIGVYFIGSTYSEYGDELVV